MPLLCLGVIDSCNAIRLSLIVANENLNTAKTAKEDESYTQLSDVERESQHHWKHFRGRAVLCNCDNPYESNFFKCFALRFNQLGLKKLIYICYNGSPMQGNELVFRFDDADPKSQKVAYKMEVTEVKDMNGDGVVDLPDVRYLLMNDKDMMFILQAGDLHSPECVALLEEADIVVSDSPFSLSREYIGQSMAYDKKFTIMGHQNVIMYKGVFPFIKENKLWLGYGFRGGATHFYSPYEDIATAGNHKEDRICVPGVNWFTNLEIPKYSEELDLVCRYSPEEHPKYDSYDVINVGRTQDIPMDYKGLMGVPIILLDKYNSNQFEIIWQASGNIRVSASKEVLEIMGYTNHKKDRGGCGAVNGKR